MRLFGPQSSGGGAGGGGSLIGYPNTNAPIEEIQSTMLVLSFEKGLGQDYYYSFQVPDGFLAGTQISFKAKFFPEGLPTVTNTMLLSATTTLIQDGDAPTSTTNQHSSTNTAVTLSDGLAVYNLSIDLTDADGLINSVEVQPNDTLLIAITRGTDTETENLCLVKGSEFIDLS